MDLLGPSKTVELAIERFSAGDDDGFVELFHPEAVIWSDPQLAQGLVLSGRDQIRAWCREARARWSDVRFNHGELSDQGSGAYVELDVVTTTSGAGGAWRLSIAVFFRDELVIEVLPQPDRETAIAALTAR